MAYFVCLFRGSSSSRASPFSELTSTFLRVCGAIAERFQNARWHIKEETIEQESEHRRSHYQYSYLYLTLLFIPDFLVLDKQVFNIMRIRYWPSGPNGRSFVGELMSNRDVTSVSRFWSSISPFHYST